LLKFLTAQAFHPGLRRGGYETLGIHIRTIRAAAVVKAAAFGAAGFRRRDIGRSAGGEEKKESESDLHG